jgi:hypothetical protein
MEAIWCPRPATGRARLRAAPGYGPRPATGRAGLRVARAAGRAGYGPRGLRAVGLRAAPGYGSRAWLWVPRLATALGRSAREMPSVR